MQKIKWLISAVSALLIFAAVVYTAAWLLIPPRQDYGSTWENYLQEPEDSIDVLFFGSSLAYCDIVPGVIWQESGISSYVMAGPEQTIPITYSYVKETCRTQSPKVIAIEVTGMFYSRYCNYTKVNISYMPWSVNRIAAIFQAAEPELRMELLFPILDYHSRWKTVEEEEVRTHLNPGVDLMAGYTFLSKSVPQTEDVYRGYSAESENYARNLKYLRRINDYCEKNEMQLLLFLNPTKTQVPPESLTQLEEDIAGLSAAVFVDFNERMDSFTIDDNNDWYDFLHFNCWGADKFSEYLAEYLTEELHLSPTEGEDEELWQTRAERFEAQLISAMETQ